MPIRSGIDITSIERVEESMSKFGDKFRERFFGELQSSEDTFPDFPPRTYAGLWAAKEATFKVIGRGYRWEGVRISYEQSGRPVLSVDYEDARLGESPIPRSAEWDCSIAHDAGMAIAFAVCYWDE